MVLIFVVKSQELILIWHCILLFKFYLPLLLRFYLPLLLRYYKETKFVNGSKSEVYFSIPKFHFYYLMHQIRDLIAILKFCLALSVTNVQKMFFAFLVLPNANAFSALLWILTPLFSVFFLLAVILMCKFSSSPFPERKINNAQFSSEVFEKRNVQVAKYFDRVYILQ